MDFQELISRLALALGIGLLFGLERGWRMREDPPGGRVAGIRTFAISGLLGGVIGSIVQSIGGLGGGIAFGFSLAAYGGVMAVFCLEQNRAQKSLSATTWVATVLTFALGSYGVMGDMTAAAALAVGATIVLAMREPLHGWVARLTWTELRSALVLLAMTFVALPIVPGGPVALLGGIDPREVWIIAIVLAGASFVGYAAVKYFGASHGMLIAGLAGGLASSTAVTIANARRARTREQAPRLLVAGVAMASAVMFVRVAAIVLAINASLLAAVLPPLIAAAAFAVVYALVAAYWRDAGRPADQNVNFRNPFAFWPVVGFAIFLGAVIVAGRWLGEWLGPAGAIAGAAVIGLVDVDAITVSLARLAPQTLGMRDAAIGILVAVATDTVSKIAIGVVIGRGRFAVEIAGMAAGCLAVGGAVSWITMSLMVTS